MYEGQKVLEMLKLVFQEGMKVQHCLYSSLVIYMVESSPSLLNLRFFQLKLSVGMPPLHLSCPIACIKSRSYCFGVLVWVVGL